MNQLQFRLRRKMYVQSVDRIAVRYMSKDERVSERARIIKNFSQNDRECNREKLPSN